MADKKYVLDQVWAARLPKMWKWMRSLRVTGAADFKNTEDGCSIAIPSAGNSDGPKAIETITVRLTALSGGGYDWKEVTAKSDGTFADVTNGRLSDDFGQAFDPTAANAFAVGDTSPPVLLRRQTDPDSGERIWMIVVAKEVGDAIAVQLATDSGSIGNKTTVSSWTYTATRMDGTAIPGATGLSPMVGWRKGKLPAASYGSGYFHTDGSFKLVVAYTTSGTGGC